MIRHILLATSMLVAAPVLAQTAPQPDPGRTPLAQTAPAPAQPAPDTVEQTTPAPQQQAPVAEATPAAGGSQVTQIVDREFPSYDKNGDGTLDATEFDAWMVALRTASDPTTKADSPATKQWLTAAFTQADADKNRGVSKVELTGFLSQGQS